MDMRIRLTFVFVVLTYVFERIKSQQCGRIKCDHKQTECGVHNTTSTGWDNTLNGCLSLPNQRCPIKDSFLNQASNGTASCENITIEYNTRYPGESCASDYKCAATFECVNTTKTCFVKASNETIACAAQTDCGVGKHCNATDSKCHDLVGENGNCTNSYECKNGYLCNFNKCIRFYSLEVGTETQAVSACKYNKVYVNNTKKYCEKWVYESSQTEKDGLVACNITNLCKYVGVNNDTYNLPCVCGYNPDGNAYCPPQDTQKTADFYALTAKTLDNKCHKSRESFCDLDKDDIDTTLKSNRKSLITDKMDVLSRHLFYKADKCARWIFGGSSNYVFVSAAVLSVMSLFMF